MILPEQCRAARAILKLSQADLAALAGLHSNTVLGFERETKHLQDSTLLALREALETAGITFIDGQWPGVRRRKTKSPEDADGQHSE